MGIGKKRNENENENGKKAFENISVFTVHARDAFSNLYILSLLEIYLSFVCAVWQICYFRFASPKIWYASFVVRTRIRP